MKLNVRVALAALLFTYSMSASAQSQNKIQQTELKCVGKYSDWKLRDSGYDSGSMDFPLYLQKQGNDVLGFTISAANTLSAIWIYGEDLSSSYKMYFKTDNKTLEEFGLQAVEGMQSGDATLDRESGEIRMTVIHDAGLVSFSGKCLKPKLQF